MIHYYYGDGKGKTTAAMGLALRQAGRGGRVTVAQFLKGEDSGERPALRALSGVTVLNCPGSLKFLIHMTPDEKKQAGDQMAALFQAAAESDCELLVLDELGSALGAGMLDRAQVADFLDRHGEDREIVATGHTPEPILMDRAHYITHMVKERHPFDQGQGARRGIEF